MRNLATCRHHNPRFIESIYMESINAWLDVEELSELANALMQPVAPENQASVENNPARERASRMLVAAKMNAESSGVIELSVDKLLDLGEWLKRNGERATGLCVVDSMSEVLFESLPNTAWRQLLQQITCSQGNLEGNMRLKVGQYGFMQLLSFADSDRVLRVALLTKQLLDEAELNDFRAIVMKLRNG